MPSKELTAKVKLNISDVESKLRTMENRIKSIQNVLNGRGNSANGLDDKLNRSIAVAEKAVTATNNRKRSEELLAAAIAKRHDVSEQAALNDIKREQQIANLANKGQQAELAKERTRQQSLNTLTKTDLIAQRMTSHANAQWWAETLTEQARQRSLRALGEGDRAAQRLADNARQRTQAEYEALWGTQQQETSLNNVANILGNIHQENGKWKLDMEGVVSSVGSLIPGYGAILSACAPIITQVLDWLGVTEAIEKIINYIMEGIKSLLNVLTLGAIKAREIRDKVREWWEEQKKAAKEASKTNDVFDSIWGKVKQIVGALIGVGTIKVAIEAADTLTGAENRLNNIAHNVFGDSAYTKSGDTITGYSEKALNFTQEAMDKMYVAAKRSRSLYSDMMNNVSKTMTLAGDAFDNNIDNAIRFQEVMSKSFAVSGASAQEISTSMYQLTQALGSGVLQGDELRSVREGAALAYQEIEKFAQGVLNTEESLKDLASQGKITSDMVVAAVLNMGDEIDQQFEMTKWRFSEVWTSIQSAAQRAFQPVVKQLTNALNEMVDNGIIEKIESIFVDISKAVMIVFDLIEKGIKWIKDNWDAFEVIDETNGKIEKSAYGLKDVVVGVLIALGTYFAITGLIAVWNALVSFTAWVAVNWPLLVIVGTLALIVWGMHKGGEAAGEVALKILQAFEVIGLGLIILGILAGNTTMMFIGGILLIIGLIMNNLNPTTGKIIGTIVKVALAFYNCIAKGINNIAGFSIYVKTVCDNIEIFFYNVWRGAAAACSDFVASCIESLQWLEGPLNAIAKAWDLPTVNLGGMAKNLRTTADSSRSLMRNFKDPAEEAKKAALLPTLTGEQIQKISLDAAVMFSSEKAFTTTFGNWLGNAGDNIKKWISEKLGLDPTDEDGEGLLDQIAKKLGLDFSDYKFPTDELNDALKKADAPKELLDALDDISENTGSIADSMELTSEDLAYLRKLADMEWKKEFTTANITIDMSNYNTISGESDLDGIVTKLSDKLYEELDYLANGVYTY